MAVAFFLRFAGYIQIPFMYKFAAYNVASPLNKDNLPFPPGKEDRTGLVQKPHQLHRRLLVSQSIEAVITKYATLDICKLQSSTSQKARNHYHSSSWFGLLIESTFCDFMSQQRGQGSSGPFDKALMHGLLKAQPIVLVLSFHHVHQRDRHTNISTHNPTSPLA